MVLEEDFRILQVRFLWWIRERFNNVLSVPQEDQVVLKEVLGSSEVVEEALVLRSLKMRGIQGSRNSR